MRLDGFGLLVGFLRHLKQTVDEFDPLIVGRPSFAGAPLTSGLPELLLHQLLKSLVEPPQFNLRLEEAALKLVLVQRFFTAQHIIRPGENAWLR